MKSKTSFFNKTVFKKNLTRFAPVMAVYTLCLILGMMMLYQNNEEMGRTFWFASRMGECIQVMGLVNLFFAPLCAMLLFLLLGAGIRSRAWRRTAQNRGRMLFFGRDD